MLLFGGGAGAMQAMINSLKMNLRKRGSKKSLYERGKDHPITGQGQLHIVPLTASEKKEIEERVTAIEQLKLRRSMISLVIITLGVGTFFVYFLFFK